MRLPGIQMGHKGRAAACGRLQWLRGNKSMNEDKKGNAAHRLTMEGREKLTISGVEDVISFDEHEILLDTLEGTLLLRGEGLHINKLSVESGELQIEGLIDTLEYSDSAPSRPGLLSRIFG